MFCVHFLSAVAGFLCIKPAPSRANFAGIVCMTRAAKSKIGCAAFVSFCLASLKKRWQHQFKQGVGSVQHLDLLVALTFMVLVAIVFGSKKLKFSGLRRACKG